MTVYPRISKVGNSYILRRYVNGKRLHFYSANIDTLIEYDRMLDNGIIPVKKHGTDIPENEINKAINDGNNWKWIENYEGLYAISDNGQVRSFWKDNLRGYPVKTNNVKGWYLSFRATGKDRKVKTIRVHVAVAQAFIGEIKSGFEVHHKDGNKQNNRVDNLEILSVLEHKRLTIKENPHILDGMIAYNKGRFMDDGRKRHARHSSSSKFGRGKICQYSLDGKFINSYFNAAEAHNKTGVCSRNILQVANKEPFNNKGGIRKQAGGYIWKFADESEVMKCSN